MKPLFSEENRQRTIWNFVSSFIQGRVRISDYNSIMNCLNDKRMIPLNNLKPSGAELVGYSTRPTGKFTLYDSKVYLDWLMSTVSGANKVDDKTLEDAYDQLYTLLIVIRADMEVHGNPQLVAPYNWEDQLTLFVDKLSRLQATIDKRDVLSAQIMERMLNWLEEYTSVLDEVKKDYTDKIGNAVSKD